MKKDLLVSVLICFMDYIKNTKMIIEKEKIEAEIKEHKKWGKESETISKIFGIALKNVIKALLVFLDETPSLIVLQGNKLLDLKKLERITGTKVTLARVRDIKKLGFQFGGIPCIGSGLKMIVDRKILDEEFVVGSAGSPYVGIKIKPKDLVRLNSAEVFDICREV
jgi:prolyl-tRNA editing enzyme YbaK/EbsC (Cys-tRNA(Pro) deacylase)